MGDTLVPGLARYHVLRRGNDTADYSDPRLAAAASTVIARRPAATTATASLSSLISAAPWRGLLHRGLQRSNLERRERDRLVQLRSTLRYTDAANVWSADHGNYTLASVAAGTRHPLRAVAPPRQYNTDNDVLRCGCAATTADSTRDVIKVHSLRRPWRFNDRSRFRFQRRPPPPSSCSMPILWRAVGARRKALPPVSRLVYAVCGMSGRIRICDVRHCKGSYETSFARLASGATTTIAVPPGLHSPSSPIVKLPCASQIAEFLRQLPPERDAYCICPTE